MKFNCGKSREQRLRDAFVVAEKNAEAARNWHKHFAWLPVRVAEGDCRWLEFVMRRYPFARVGWTVFDEPCVRHGGYVEDESMEEYEAKRREETP